ncbi:DNA repair protein RecO [Candidatus Anaplasma sp. TIGMIC]|uniref:DNA repair protein RecO n=1 Tax=Candidatus Anaplasma sp. TIGMIC TaxID=3020713 RepID=UPI00232EA459|nr:DNA repair protein RecO [Candidatus Anaplasma sp. TIGMIC]MDB1135423.1 DNA repair protein RecO [Candidatus Anaplasma sp. TIGMIC]
MQWQDHGMVVNMSPYGDTRVILSVFTRNHGLYNGLIRRCSKKQSLQIGDRISVTWRARLVNNLGYFSSYEVLSSSFYSYFQDRSKLLCLSSITATIYKSIPTNYAHPSLYDYLVEFADAAETGKHWYSKYLKLELEVLSQLGFALDLSKCAVYNSTENLQFISPKTGRAISEKAGAQYRHMLFPLPGILRDLNRGISVERCTSREFAVCLRILGFFLHRHLLSEDANFVAQRKTMGALLFSKVSL